MSASNNLPTSHQFIIEVLDESSSDESETMTMESMSTWTRQELLDTLRALELDSDADIGFPPLVELALVQAADENARQREALGETANISTEEGVQRPEFDPRGYFWMIRETECNIFSTLIRIIEIGQDDQARESLCQVNLHTPSPWTIFALRAAITGACGYLSDKGISKYTVKAAYIAALNHLVTVISYEMYSALGTRAIFQANFFEMLKNEIIYQSAYEIRPELFCDFVCVHKHCNFFSIIWNRIGTEHYPQRVETPMSALALDEYDAALLRTYHYESSPEMRSLRALPV